MPFSIHPLRFFPVVFASLITLLLLSNRPAYAEWVELGSVESAGGYAVYVDPDTIRRKEDLVKMWALYDYTTVQTVKSKSFLSAKLQQEYDCTEERIRMLAFWAFSDNRGGGYVVWSNSDEREWEPVPPGSIGQLMWKLACGKL